MEHGNGASDTPLYTLIPLTDFKAILGLDDREEALSRFCLTTATFTIEQYCMRRLLLKRHFERIEFHGDLVLPLREYPVREILEIKNEELKMKNEGVIEPEWYSLWPEGGVDVPHVLRLLPALGQRGVSEFKVVYRAGYRAVGYACGEAGDPWGVLGDLAAACFELAAWNMSRYRGRRIGMTGAVRGSGKDGEHLEATMSENVRQLLEPYRRKVI